MEKEFVPYEQAFALKDLGLDEPCFGFYNDMENNKPMGGNFPCDGRNSAPLYQQAFSFFREKYELDGWAVPYLKLNGSKVYSYIIDGADYDEDDCELNTHEEAELECIKKLIEISKNK
jgi:hypothetical protein